MVTFVLNLVGGFLFAVVFAVPEVLPSGTHHALRSFAEHSSSRPMETWFASGITGGALVSLLSFLLAAVEERSVSRILLSYILGVMLALGPFDHVIVTMLHLFFGVLFGATVGVETMATMLVVITAGNLVGGLGLVTLSHVLQAMGEDLV